MLSDCFAAGFFDWEPHWLWQWTYKLIDNPDAVGVIRTPKSVHLYNFMTPFYHSNFLRTLSFLFKPLTVLCYHCKKKFLKNILGEFPYITVPHVFQDPVMERQIESQDTFCFASFCFVLQLETFKLHQPKRKRKYSICPHKCFTSLNVFKNLNTPIKMYKWLVALVNVW